MSDGPGFMAGFVFCLFLVFALMAIVPPPFPNERKAELLCRKAHGTETKDYRVCMANELWLKEPKP